MDLDNTDCNQEADITIYDRVTKESRTVHWGPGYSAEYWWQQGNGHCDCNRHLYFWDWDAEKCGEDDPCGNERYIITHVDGEPVSFEDWNSGYSRTQRRCTN